MSYNKELEFAKQLAKEAGEIMLRYFRADDIGTSWKYDSSPLTQADTEINALVIKRVKELFPKHAVIGEEESLTIEADYIWLVDPVDGTLNYSAGLPLATFSLALVDKSDGQPVIGVIYDPFCGRLWEATKEHVLMNGETCKVSTIDLPSKKAIIDLSGLGYQPGKHIIEPISLVGRLAKAGFRITIHQSIAICSALVASGELVANIVNVNTPEDIAAVKLIVEQAGGRVTDLHGNEQRYDRPIKGAIVSNGLLHNTIVSVCKDGFV